MCMEVTCSRCHRTVLPESSYCPSCGLPQFVYEADADSGQSPADRLDEAVQDASTVTWKPALRAALLLALPAGILSSGIPSPLLGFLGPAWTAGAAAWAVALYVRSQRRPWITMGAGARIGLVTGIMVAWLAFAINGGTLFVERFALHRTSEIDSAYRVFLDTFQSRAQASVTGARQADAAQLQATMAGLEAWLGSSWGRAGIFALGFAMNALMLLFFATGGGALGARWQARSRRFNL